MFYCFFVYMIVCFALCFILPASIDPVIRQWVIVILASIAGLDILATMYLSLK